MAKKKEKKKIYFEIYYASSKFNISTFFYLKCRLYSPSSFFSLDISNIISKRIDSFLKSATCNIKFRLTSLALGVLLPGSYLLHPHTFHYILQYYDRYISTYSWHLKFHLTYSLFIKSQDEPFGSLNMIRRIHLTCLFLQGVPPA